MEMLGDLKFALRMIRKAPAASLVVVLTLGFGIGANGIFFASFYGSALRPLPFSEPDRLVAIQQSQPQVDETLKGISAPVYRELQRDEGQRGEWQRDEGHLQGSVFSAVGAYTWQNYSFQTDDGTYRVEGSAVSTNLFPLLGVEPQLGRHFSAEEGQPNGPKVVLISHRIWHEHFAGDPRILGETLKLDGESHEIVGVMPEGFRFSHYGLAWTPLQVEAHAQPRT